MDKSHTMTPPSQKASHSTVNKEIGTLKNQLKASSPAVDKDAGGKVVMKN